MASTLLGPSVPESLQPHAPMPAQLKDEYLAVYGTLRRRSLFQRRPRISGKLRFFCFGQLRAKSFWQYDYPAAVPGFGVVPVEIFRVIDSSAWSELDQYEGCTFDDASASIFHRKQVRLLQPSLVVWVYLLGPAGQRRGRILAERFAPGSRFSRIIASRYRIGALNIQ
jgi:gamma-glutamylcyclotransferase (GGCT)/AIG2-like uncharacterized protein YtfP